MSFSTRNSILERNHSRSRRRSSWRNSDALSVLLLPEIKEEDSYSASSRDNYSIKPDIISRKSSVSVAASMNDFYETSNFYINQIEDLDLGSPGNYQKSVSLNLFENFNLFKYQKPNYDDYLKFAKINQSIQVKSQSYLENFSPHPIKLMDSKMTPCVDRPLNRLHSSNSRVSFTSNSRQSRSVETLKLKSIDKPKSFAPITLEDSNQLIESSKNAEITKNLQIKKFIEEKNLSKVIIQDGFGSLATKIQKLKELKNGCSDGNNEGLNQKNNDENLEYQEKIKAFEDLVKKSELVRKGVQDKMNEFKSSLEEYEKFSLAEKDKSDLFVDMLFKLHFDIHCGKFKYIPYEERWRRVATITVNGECICVRNHINIQNFPKSSHLTICKTKSTKSINLLLLHNFTSQDLQQTWTFFSTYLKSHLPSPSPSPSSSCLNFLSDSWLKFLQISQKLIYLKSLPLSLSLSPTSTSLILAGEFRSIPFQVPLSYSTIIEEKCNISKLISQQILPNPIK